MTKKNFTSGFIGKSQCDTSKKQSIFYDAKTPGLGLRVTSAGAKSYIFESRLNGKTIRLTIGDAKSWPLAKAQTEAARLKVSIDQGIDPRQQAADQKAAKQAAAAEKKAQEMRETVTFCMAWEKYLIDRKNFWGDRHYRDHVEMMRPGGEKRTRSSQLTEPGVLASLANVRLIDLTTERIQQWATKESETRSGRARIGFRLLKAFLMWCSEQPEFREIVTYNPTKNKRTREILGKPETNEVVLQREQLPVWFAAIKQMHNPIVSAYFQTLMLIGSRPNELIELKWEDIDFQWRNMTIRDKVEGMRVIPLTPYVSHLLAMLPRRNQFVFSSLTSESGHLVDVRAAHDKACSIAGIDGLTIYALRGSFASLCEWIQCPAGISAQIQGHKPSGVREKHYIRRPLDLLRMWHVKIEAWILEQAGIEFIPAQTGLHVVKK